MPMRLLLRSLLSPTLFVTLVLAFILPTASHAQPSPQLLRAPSLSDSLIAFRHADDVWTVPRQGGSARRLTSTGNVSEGPFFSPDGQTIAYSATVAGSLDVYTIPVTGGVPHHVTYHPGGNYVIGWTPDGHDLLFASMQDSVRMYFQLFRVAASGAGLPQQLPLPSAYVGTYSPDASHFAYNPWLQWQEDSWKRYRGGQTQPIWIVDLKSLDLVKVPRENSNDRYPLWLGDSIYFLSDRNGPISLFAYDTHTKAIRQLVENHGLDFKTLTGRGDTLAYEQFGTIHLYDIPSGKEHAVEITTAGDLPALLPHLASILPAEIQNAAISPTGVRALFEAHGDIFTVPEDKGDVRNLTNSSSSAEREPAWSPDGKHIAYFSDASGEYQLCIRDQDGLKPPQMISLGPDPTYYYSPVWSPDSKRIVFSDKRLHLWLVNLDPALGPATPILVANALREGFGPANFSASFSPDAKWVLYSTSLPNFEDAAYLYNIASAQSTQITDGMSEVTNPVFDAGGKYIFFTASTDNGPGRDGFGLGSLNRTTSASVYVAVLSKDEKSPIPPESDDEKAKPDDDKKTAPSDASSSEEKKNAAVKPEVKDDSKKPRPDLPETKIDLDGIQQRILALPIPARNYVQLQAGKPGVILLGEAGPAANPADGDPQQLRSLWRFTLKDRKTEDVLHDISGVVVSFDGDRVLYRKHAGFFISPMDGLTAATAEGTPGKPLHVDAMQARVDPRAEWQQEYNETWRIEREFFYDPGYHGLDLAAIKARYEPWVAGLSSRSDLTYLMQEMLGEITVGHMFINYHAPGDDKAPKTGLLGADYTIDHDRYKIAHIVQGGNWDPKLNSPLTQPGVNVHEGEYLLAVNGTPLHADQNLYAAFEGLAGKQTTLTVGPNPDASGSRDVLVVPVDSETDMHMQQWIEGNIRRADQLSGGKVAYVYLPNTAGAGFDSFNRYFFAQTQKQAVIVDDRWNQGGDIADYVIDVLKRTPMLNYESRNGLHTTEPTGAIFGPKAMLINQNAGSGGDAMPWLFRQASLGPLVGTRTWGGLVGIGGYPVLQDGGSVTAPRTALYGLTGKFDIENIGVPPDVEVQDNPKSFSEGHDPQLEKAVQLLLEQLKAHPPVTYPVPPYPNYHQHDGLGPR
jgi:tricorn protease